MSFLVTATFSAQANTINEDYCQRISDRAKRSGIKVMVIGVEGLMQMNGDHTARLYKYSEARKAGQTLKIPTGFYPLSPLPVAEAGVTRGLMIPLMRNSGTRIEPIVVGEESIKRGSFSTAQACAQIWKSVPGRKLIIAGHSYGGPAAIDLASNLRSAGVRVDALYSIDSVPRPDTGQLVNPGNIGYFANYRVNSLTIPGARDFVLEQGAGHMNIPGHRAILEDVERQISTATRSATPAKKTNPPAERQAYRIGIDFPPPTATR